MRNARQLESGAWLQYETSTLHPKYPVQSSPVRTQVAIAGFLFEPHAEGTMVTYISHVDIGGSIPSYLVSLGDSKAAQRIQSFRKVAAAMKK